MSVPKGHEIVTEIVTDIMDRLEGTVKQKIIGIHRNKINTVIHSFLQTDKIHHGRIIPSLQTKKNKDDLEIDDERATQFWWGGG